MVAGVFILAMLAGRVAAPPAHAEPHAPSVASEAPVVIDFDRDIRPMLADACFKCHGPDAEARKAKLRLDLRESLFGPTRDGGDQDRDESLPSRIVAPGDPDASELVRRIYLTDADEVMPPPDAARQLSSAERERLRYWISSGAVWSGHWAFGPVKPIEPPVVTDPSWCRNDIDRFVLAAIQQRRDGSGTSASLLSPAKHADARTLIRRLSLDLTGLPPTRDEVAAFLGDREPGAYERIVDRLLASPRFGEHMAASWMELARYSDSNGFQLDLDRTAWPWRDWVIEAFNANMPYDRFITEQLAGDLLPDAAEGQVLATAFNRNHPINGEGGREIEESRIDYVHDRVDATSTAFIGLTMSCAQCHDHKYDPVTQRDYYRFFAFFDSIDEDGGGDKGDMPPVLEYKDRSGRDLRVMVMRDRAEARVTRVLERGAWDHPGEIVQPATPSALPALVGAPANRLGLARWLTDPSNPLTARVQVNRLWQQVFGQGLVRTPENFGIQGERPTHPELLDWLAGRFVESGWDIKRLLREIVTSATYSQSSSCPPGLLELDPENRLLARAPRFRMGAGEIRDQALLAAGLLVEKVGGPPVKPYHPAGVWEDVSFGRLKYEPGTGEDLYRRSLYTFWRRTAPPANMFDVSLRQNCSVRVIRTNTPLQSLILMNDPTYAEAAAALASRAMREVREIDDRGNGEGGSVAALAREEAVLACAWELVLARRPDTDELAVLTSRWHSLRAYYTEHLDEARLAACAGASADPPEDRWVEVASLAGVIGVILNLDETLTRE